MSPPSAWFAGEEEEAAAEELTKKQAMMVPQAMAMRAGDKRPAAVDFGGAQRCAMLATPRL